MWNVTFRGLVYLIWWERIQLKPRFPDCALLFTHRSDEHFQEKRVGFAASRCLNYLIWKWNSSEEDRCVNWTPRVSTYYQENAQLWADGQFANAKVEVSGVGKRLQMWQAAGRAAQSSAESVWTHGRRGWWWWGRYGGSVAASHWCALSYVGINHDSEMTYFLTPQTNSTFNRSQGFCQSTFSPCSLSKKKKSCM